MGVTRRLPDNVVARAAFFAYCRAVECGYSVPDTPLIRARPGRSMSRAAEATLPDDQHPDPGTLDGLWRRVDGYGAARPAWRDAANAPPFRSYGGGDARLGVDGDVLRLALRGVGSKGVLVFACVFVPAFTAAAWLLIPDPKVRVIFGVLGPFAGLCTFALIYALLRWHESLGDYLVVDRAARVVRLPRLKAEFPFAQVVAFQWIRGRSRHDGDVHTDLNLLVAEPAGLTRYHVMGDPRRRQIEQVVRFSGIPVDESNLGWRGYRDADINMEKK